MVIKVAITGNIASGKSQVEKIIEDYGYNVYDSDKIAHEVLNTITDFYGYDVFTDGRIDRKKLGNLVFSNPNLRIKLEKITHPKIKSKIIRLINENKNNKYVFISVPLLYEAGFEDIFDKVLFISVDKNTQLKRLIARNNFTKEEAEKRINSQLAQEEKIKNADYIIENNKSIDDLKIEVRKFLEVI